MQDAEVDAKSVNRVYSYSCSSYREFPLALANLLVPVSCLATLITLPGDLKGDSSKTLLMKMLLKTLAMHSPR